MSFQSLGLSASLVKTLERMGFHAPTAVQTAAIPKVLEGKDLMVSAQTGSGKTAAFMLPTLQSIMAGLQDSQNQQGRRGQQGRHGQQAFASADRGKVSVLVLAPTRELAMQVGQATQEFAASYPGCHVAVVVGGVSYGAQIKALSRRVDVLVATPGRLMDHLAEKRVDLSAVQTLILDEADRMLDMGFIRDIERIVAQTPTSRQTLLFSATLDGSVAKLARDMMKQAEVIQVSTPKQNHDNISQSLLYADDAEHKHNLLNHLLRDAQLDQAVVFTATRRGADRLARRLSKQGFASEALHGDMNQRQRSRTLRRLQRRQAHILVATDVAARGIDIEGITHVINYDLPMQAEDYTHRIGRTGRAGNNGQAFTLALVDELRDVRRIERFIGQPIPTELIDGLEPSQSPRFDDKGRKKTAGRPRRRRARAGESHGAVQGRGVGQGTRGHSDGGVRTRTRTRAETRSGSRGNAARGGADRGRRQAGAARR